MIRRFLPLFLCLVAALPVRSQEKYATIVEDSQVFTMQSLSEGSLTVRRTVEVYSRKGAEAAVFTVYTDKRETLSAFSGTLTARGGKKENIKKKDLTTVSVASGIAEDGFLTTYEPLSATYPYTITYEYTVQYRKGFAVFPKYIPVDTEKTALKAGTYTLVVPSGTVVRHWSSPATGTCKPTPGDKTDRYVWEIRDYDGFIDEAYMPSWTELVPMVIASPDAFVFDGVAGRQDSWKELGEWQQRLLEETGALPAETVEKVRQMTAEAGSDLEKIRILYDYLRDRTRYVSIQFGIGGFKPFPAATVDKTGFGDCKALTNYLLRLLNAAGIEARYTILNTRRRDFLPGNASFGQTNHVILSVPLPALADTLFLECTNPSLPLGYRHDNLAGHEMVLIGKDGGEPARARAYPDSLSRSRTLTHVRLSSDGSATVDVTRDLWTDQIEPWIGFNDLDKDAKQRLMTLALAVQPQNLTFLSYTDNFDSYDGPAWYPTCRIDYRFDVRSYGQPSDGRMRLAANPFSTRMKAQRTQRVNPVVFRSGSVYEDEITIDLPEGYNVESLPPDVHEDQVWGSFHSTARVEANQVRITQYLHLKPCRMEPEGYAGFRDFTRALNRAYAGTLVLRKAD